MFKAWIFVILLFFARIVYAQPSASFELNTESWYRFVESGSLKFSGFEELFTEALQSPKLREKLESDLSRSPLWRERSIIGAEFRESLLQSLRSKISEESGDLSIFLNPAEEVLRLERFRRFRVEVKERPPSEALIQAIALDVTKKKYPSVSETEIISGPSGITAHFTQVYSAHREFERALERLRLQEERKPVKAADALKSFEEFNKKLVERLQKILMQDEELERELLAQARGQGFLQEISNQFEEVAKFFAKLSIDSFWPSKSALSRWNSSGRSPLAKNIRFSWNGYDSLKLKKSERFLFFELPNMRAALLKAFDALKAAKSPTELEKNLKELNSNAAPLFPELSNYFRRFNLMKEPKPGPSIENILWWGWSQDPYFWNVRQDRAEIFKYPSLREMQKKERKATSKKTKNKFFRAFFLQSRILVAAWAIGGYWAYPWWEEHAQEAYKDSWLQADVNGAVAWVTKNSDRFQSELWTPAINWAQSLGKAPSSQPFSNPLGNAAERQKLARGIIPQSGSGGGSDSEAESVHYAVNSKEALFLVSPDFSVHSLETQAWAGAHKLDVTVSEFDSDIAQNSGFLSVYSKSPHRSPFYIPVNPGSAHLVSLKVFRPSDDKTLPVRVEKILGRFYRVDVLEESISGYQFRAAFAPEDQKDLSELDGVKFSLDDLRPEARKLKEAGFFELAEALLDPSLPEKTLEDLKQFFVRFSIYQKTEDGSPAVYSLRNFNYASLKPFIKKGCLYGQCDEGNFIFAYFMNQLFEQKQLPYLAINVTAYVDNLDRGTALTQDEGHLVSLVFSKKPAAANKTRIFDATPASGDVFQDEMSRMAKSQSTQISPINAQRISRLGSDALDLKDNLDLLRLLRILKDGKQISTAEEYRLFNKIFIDGGTFNMPSKTMTKIRMEALSLPSEFWLHSLVSLKIHASIADKELMQELIPQNQSWLSTTALWDYLMKTELEAERQKLREEFLNPSPQGKDVTDRVDREIQLEGRIAYAARDALQLMNAGVDPDKLMPIIIELLSYIKTEEGLRRFPEPELLEIVFARANADDLKKIEFVLQKLKGVQLFGLYLNPWVARNPAMRPYAANQVEAWLKDEQTKDWGIALAHFWGLKELAPKLLNVIGSEAGFFEESKEKIKFVVSIFSRWNIQIPQEIISNSKDLEALTHKALRSSDFNTFVTWIYRQPAPIRHKIKLSFDSDTQKDLDRAWKQLAQGKILPIQSLFETAKDLDAGNKSGEKIGSDIYGRYVARNSVQDGISIKHFFEGISAEEFDRWLKDLEGFVSEENTGNFPKYRDYFVFNSIFRSELLEKIKSDPDFISDQIAFFLYMGGAPELETRAQAFALSDEKLRQLSLSSYWFYLRTLGSKKLLERIYAEKWFDSKLSAEEVSQLAALAYFYAAVERGEDKKLIQTLEGKSELSRSVVERLKNRQEKRIESLNLFESPKSSIPMPPQRKRGENLQPQVTLFKQEFEAPHIYVDLTEPPAPPDPRDLEHLRKLKQELVGWMEKNSRIIRKSFLRDSSSPHQGLFSLLRRLEESPIDFQGLMLDLNEWTQSFDRILNRVSADPEWAKKRATALLEEGYRKRVLELSVELKALVKIEIEKERSCPRVFKKLALSAASLGSR